MRSDRIAKPEDIIKWKDRYRYKCSICKKEIGQEYVIQGYKIVCADRECVKRDGRERYHRYKAKKVAIIN